MNQMGNLEKFGILVIVILVVVVGVVAITPKDQVDAALFPTDTPPVTDAERVDPADDVLADPLAAGTGTAAESGSGDGTAGDARGWPIPPLGARATDLPPVVVGGSSGTQQDGTTTSGQGGTTGLVAPPTPVAPQTTEYTVQKGDTPSKIAAKLLGRSSLWTLIADANPGLDPKRMKIGQVLKIPARPDAGATVQATPPQAPIAGGLSSSGGATPIVPTPEPAPAATAERTIVVQPGETLTSIARRELKSSTRWREILVANEDVLHGSDKLRGGMKLRIPAQSGTTAVTPTPSPASTPTAGRTYKVQKGDSLSSIASRFLGTSSRWREIQRANDGVLHGSDTIREGMELVIPDQVSAR